MLLRYHGLIPSICETRSDRDTQIEDDPYSCPPGDISYDGRPLVTVPISTPEAATQIVLLWSRLREPDPNFSQIVELLSRP